MSPITINFYEYWEKKENISILYNSAQIKNNKVINKIKKTENDIYQIIIIDISHKINIGKNEYRVVYFRPKSIKEVMFNILDLNLMINPRVKLIIVNDLPYFFRDLHEDNALNLKLYASSLQMLQNVSKSARIIITSFESGYKINYPVFHDVNCYYNIPTYKIINDDPIVFQNVNDL